MTPPLSIHLDDANEDWLATGKTSGKTAREASIRTALYHHERGRKYRPTRAETESGKYTCPYCATALVSITLRPKEKGLSCPRCHWSIHRDDLWSPKPDETPATREPGDATEDPPPAFEIRMDEVIKPEAPPGDPERVKLG